MRSTQVRALAALAATWAVEVSPAGAGVVNTNTAARAAAAAAAGFTDTVTPDYVPLTGHLHPNFLDMHLARRNLATLASVGGPANNVSASLVNVRDMYYIAELTVGKEKIPLHVDTGSSDTWMVKSPYQCVPHWNSDWRKPANCGLGVGLQGELSGGRVPNAPSFVREYADGTWVTGYFGYGDVGLGGLVAQNQRIAIVNRTSWIGEGRTSGLLGLAYPYMTSLDGSSETQPLYDPVFTTLWKEKLIAPLFSIALSRYAGDTTPAQVASQKMSYLALGGLPPVDLDEGSWARTKIQDMSALDWGLNTTEHGLYVITPEAYVYGNSEGTLGKELTKNSSQFPVLIDVGASLNILPKILTENLYKSFDPPAEYSHEGGLYYAKCDAKVPQFGIQIGGRVLYMAPEDLLRQNIKDSTGKLCLIGVTDSDYQTAILGVPFLASVVAVFDVEHHEMRFAQRTKY